MICVPVSIAVIPEISGSLEAFHAAVSPAVTFAALAAVAVYDTDALAVPSGACDVIINVSPTSTPTGLMVVRRTNACVSAAPPLLALLETVKGIPIALPVIFTVSPSAWAEIPPISALVDEFHSPASCDATLVVDVVVDVYEMEAVAPLGAVTLSV